MKVGGNLIVLVMFGMKFMINVVKFFYKCSFNKVVNVFFVRGVKV